MSNERPRGYVKPPAAVQVGVRDFIARHGEKVAFDHFGLARATIARAGAGFVLQGSVLRAIEEGLARPVDAAEVGR